jgi:hypothetical protein
MVLESRYAHILRVAVIQIVAVTAYQCNDLSFKRLSNMLTTAMTSQYCSDAVQCSSFTITQFTCYTTTATADAIHSTSSSDRHTLL